MAMIPIRKELPTYGALMALEGSGLGLEERALTALRAAERFSTGVRGPFRVVAA